MLHSNRLQFGDFGPEGDAFRLGKRAWRLDAHRFGSTNTVAEDRQSFRFAQEMQRLPESRRQLIFQVRRQVAEGTYDTPRKFEAALDRFLETLAADSAP